MTSSFAVELENYGPHTETPPPTLAAAQQYCRQFARRNYENFTVGSWLLPRRLRDPFFSIYSYCRWADDLADETGGGARSLALLDWWRGQLLQCYDGEARHPVFVALRETIERFQIPPEPFLDLLVAFRRDQSLERFQTADELLQYCRYSANPVGRLVLHLGDAATPAHVALSDSICTGLQLINFWQDVARDYRRGRIYLPVEACRKAGYDRQQFGRPTKAFTRLLEPLVSDAEAHLLAGRPLTDTVPKELCIEVELFLRGGLAVAAAIRRQRFDIWSRRPTVGKTRKLMLLVQAWWVSRRAR